MNEELKARVINDELKARIVLDVIDIKTGFSWNNNDDVWIDAIKSAFREIRLEEMKCYNKEIGSSLLDYKKGGSENE